MSDSILASIQPIVLVGGRSRRFGRDKLREPLGEASAEWLVDRPIRALREVFGARVAAVGACDPEVAARFDWQLPDHYPGTGPAGGILAALENSAGDVFVLAGDLPNITAGAVRAVLAGASAASEAWVVLAEAEGVHPCIGLYRREVQSLLGMRLAFGIRSLYDLAPEGMLEVVRIEVGEAKNVNWSTEF